MSSEAVKDALAKSEKWLNDTVGNWPKGVWIPVFGPSGEAVGNAMANFFDSKGIPPQGVRVYEDGYQVWLQGQGLQHSSQNLDTWCGQMWYTLPLNAEYARGVKFKLRWKDGRWHSWRPDEQQKPEEFNYGAPKTDNFHKGKAQIEDYMAAMGKVPESVVLPVFDPEADEPTNKFARWLKDRRVTVYGVRMVAFAYHVWLNGRQDTEDMINKWTTFIWENLPLNAEFAKGVKYKLEWSNGRWQDWKP